jgi:hypothetical protein
MKSLKLDKFDPKGFLKLLGLVARMLAHRNLSSIGFTAIGQIFNPEIWNTVSVSDGWPRKKEKRIVYDAPV